MYILSPFLIFMADKIFTKKGVRIPNSPLNYHLKCAKALFASAIL